MDLRRWFNVFRRRIRLFIAVALVVFAAAVMLTLQATPRYTATASVVLDTRKTNVTGVQQVMSDMPTDASAVATEVEILKSGQLAERVVKALNLDEDPEFNPALRKPKGLGAIRASVRDLVKGAAPKTAPTPAQLQRAHEGVVNNVLKGLQIRRTGMTYVIAIGYESESPTKAAAIANKWSELYLLDQLQSKFEATQQATRWLNEQLGSLRGQVEQDDAAVQQYRIANNLLSASGTSLTEQEISSYSQSLASARAERSIAAEGHS